MAVERLVLVRHGETAWSRRRRHTGRTDLPLDEEGRRQGAALAVALARYTFSAVFCSPLQRARETAGLAGFGDRAETLDDLREWDYGDLEGRTTDEYRASLPSGGATSGADRREWSVWSGPVPNGETLEQVGARADAVIARVSALSGEVALFGHAHLLRVLTARWCGLPPVEGRRFQLSTASVCVLGWEREEAGIESWNHVPGTL
jgi:probable phosphoglycerate mutase